MECEKNYRIIATKIGKSNEIEIEFYQTFTNVNNKWFFYFHEST